MPKVSIGIPAYNEALNIQRVINEVLSQETSGLDMYEILVASDASTDQTVEIVQSINDKRIKIIKNTIRLGRAGNINTIFEHAGGDILFIIDADVFLGSKDYVQRLVNVLLNNPTLSMVSGKAKAVKPTRLFEKIIYHGTKIWSFTINSVPGSEMYKCGGSTSVYTKSLYSTMRFPATSADDVFPFLYCKYHDLGWRKAPDAFIYYRLPKSLADYSKQKSRHLSSDSSIQKFFPKEFLDKYYVIKIKHKLKSLLINLFMNPILTSAYVFILLIPKISSVIHNEDYGQGWELQKTTRS